MTVTPASALLPAGTLPSGVTMLDPVSAGDGWHTVDVSFDIVNLLALLDLVVEWSVDAGATWLLLGALLGVSGPSLDAQGILQTVAKFHVEFGDSNVAAQIRTTLTNYGLPLVHGGGSMQVA